MVCVLFERYSFRPTNEARDQSWPWRSDDHSVKMISSQFQGPYPVPRGPSMANDSEKMFQIEARGQKHGNWRNNERRLEQSSVVTFWWELHICGWFGCYLKDIHSDQPKEARGQSWPRRSDDHSVKMISDQFQGPEVKVDLRGQVTTLSKWYEINSRGHPQYLGAHPWPKILKKCFK